MDKKIHVLLSSGDNVESLVTNSLYIGEVNGGAEHLCIKDEFGDAIFLRDELTDDLERFTNNFIDVSSTVSWQTEPRIVFQISHASTKKEVFEELHRNFKAGEVNFKPMKEMFQVNNERFELAPFLLADSVYSVLSINNSPGSTLYENLRTLLTETWSNMDMILIKLWDCYKLLANTTIDVSLSMARQFSRIINIDMGIIETKIRIDQLTQDTKDINWAENRWVAHTLDLRAQSSARLYRLKVNSLDTPAATIAKWFIIQDNTIDEARNRNGIAIIEMLKGKIIDFKQNNFNVSGIKILPIHISLTPTIALSGGARYIVLRTPQGTSPLDLTLEEITNNVSNFKELNSIEGRTFLMGDAIKVNSNAINVKSDNGSEYFKLQIG